MGRISLLADTGQKNAEKDQSPDTIGSNSSEAEDAQKIKIEYPDLYIPLMSFITYILLIGFNSAYQSSKM